VDKTSPSAISRLVEGTEAAAVADLLRVAPVEWRTLAEETAAGFLLLAPTVDMLLFNRLVGCGVERPARRDDMLAVIARLRGAGVKNFGVQLAPAAQPLELPAWLGDAGLTRRDRWAKVYRGADPAAPVATDLEIRPVERSEAATFAHVVAAGFGMPPVLRSWIAAAVGRPNWRHYLAWDGATPVAGAALFMYGDAGWLGVASTLPPARRRGAQGALMARRIEDGGALGCRWFVTETGEDTPARPNPSYRNMVRAGFTLAYHRDNFMPPIP
jgi:hypothetical protein